MEEKLVENGYKKMALGELFIKPVSKLESCDAKNIFQHGCAWLDIEENN